jgi:CheY-like chemotaxis protein
VGALSSKILAVDDAVEFCEALKWVLDAQGFERTVAENGQVAINLLADHEPHLILLDWDARDERGRILEASRPTQRPFGHSGYRVVRLGSTSTSPQSLWVRRITFKNHWILRLF